MEINKKAGLYNRYKVEKTSGRPIDPKAKYFIMRYDKHGSDPIHIRACQLAVEVYAHVIKDHLPQLSEDLLNELKARKI